MGRTIEYFCVSLFFQLISIQGFATKFVMWRESVFYLLRFELDVSKSAKNVFCCLFTSVVIFFRIFQLLDFYQLKKKKKKESFRPHFFEDGVIFLYS